MSDNAEFRVHVLTAEGLSKARNIAAQFDELLDALAEKIPPGRYLSIVKTKLEEACFFAKKGIAEDPRNQLQAGAP